ncbi:MAG: stage III sporulation protein AG [Lachnospiraceae bacterium]|nr:stage III sporulation protein AG [Lachnospiraceae bacterium]
MGQIKKLMNKITGGTKMRKDQLLIMVLCGILLCIIALPIGGSDSGSVFFGKTSNKSDSDYDIVENNNQDTSGKTTGTSVDYDLSYISYWEEKLKQSLSCIDGVGEVEVLITLKESEERVPEKDIPEEIKETVETDAEGGNRTIMEKSLKESTIYTVNEAGQNVPYVSKVIQPVVEGVVVIAQGGDSDTVKLNIIETIKVLFAIDVNKIRVVKMKTNIK